MSERQAYYCPLSGELCPTPRSQATFTIKKSHYDPSSTKRFEPGMCGTDTVPSPDRSFYFDFSPDGYCSHAITAIQAYLQKEFPGRGATIQSPDVHTVEATVGQEVVVRIRRGECTDLKPRRKRK